MPSPRFGEPSAPVRCREALLRVRGRTLGAWCVALLLSGLDAAYAQDSSELVMRIVAGNSQSTAIGQPFKTQLKVRLTDRQGIPFVGTPVLFANDICLSFSAGPSTCPFTGAPGHFVSGDGAIVVTDGSGYATAPLYYAGESDGIVGVMAYASPGVGPYAFTIPESINHIVVFQLGQGVTVPGAGIPLLSTGALLATGFMLLLFGGLALRGRK
jgi:hypothetical protein